MAKKRIGRTIDVAAATVTFTEVASDKSIVVKLADMPAAMVTRLALHGINGKVGDSAANPEVDAIATMSGVVATLVAGEWGASRGTGTTRVTDLLTALMAVTDQDQESAQKVLDDMTDEHKKDLRKHPAMKAEIAEMRAKREAAKAKAAKAEAKDAAPLVL